MGEGGRPFVEITAVSLRRLLVLDEADRAGSRGWRINGVAGETLGLNGFPKARGMDEGGRGL